MTMDVRRRQTKEKRDMKKDQWRQSLEKLLRSQTLTLDQNRSALSTLITKLEILVAGAEKRDNREIVEKFQPSLAFWSERLQEFC